MPTSRDMAIFVLTTTTTRLSTLPLAHARGVISYALESHCLFTPRGPGLEINGNQLKSTEINQEITRNHPVKSLAVADPPTFI